MSGCGHDTWFVWAFRYRQGHKRLVAAVCCSDRRKVCAFFIFFIFFLTEKILQQLGGVGVDKAKSKQAGDHWPTSRRFCPNIFIYLLRLFVCDLWWGCLQGAQGTNFWEEIIIILDIKIHIFEWHTLLAKLNYEKLLLLLLSQDIVMEYFVNASQFDYTHFSMFKLSFFSIISGMYILHSGPFIPTFQEK